MKNYSSINVNFLRKILTGLHEYNYPGVRPAPDSRIPLAILALNEVKSIGLGGLTVCYRVSCYVIGRPVIFHIVCRPESSSGGECLR